ncbi:E3 ubiquitin-protein ligase SlrP [compost metagenome]
MSTSHIPAIPGLHGRFLAERLPDFLKHATPADLKRWREIQRPAQWAPSGSAVWFDQADEYEQRMLLHLQDRSRLSTQALATALKHLKGVGAFAEPLLKAALKDSGLLRTLEHTVDVNTDTLVELRYESQLLGSLLRLVPRQQTLMQAALQNFADGTRFEKGSALAPKGGFTFEFTPDSNPERPRFQYRYTQKLAIEPERFAALCHELDVGGKYQAHLREVFEHPATADVVRTLSINADKDHLRLAAQVAFMKGEITESAHTMLTALLNGQRAPHLHGKPVTYQSLSMFDTPLDGVLVFSADRISSDREEPIIAYLPGAPLYPLKEYASVAEFKKDLRINLLNPAYLTLFQDYVPKHEQAHFFSRVNEALYVGAFNADANLHMRDMQIETELFGYRQDQHLQRLKANARYLAVPSAEVDEAARQQRLAYWESIGFNVLNAAAFFIPALGGVMAVVGAAQMIKEVIDGAHAWEAGEREEALAHFESVGLNIALAAGLGGSAHGVAPMQASEQVDSLLRVTLPGGEQRLWKPDLAPYARDFDLADITPDDRGLFRFNDETTCIRIDEQVYEVSQGEEGTWSIRHPDDPHAYQPALRHNGEGAWQAVGEQPLQWTHTQLLRRIGHAADGLSDQELEQAAQVSGVDDDVLRRMHVDHLAVPPLLSDALRRYQVDQRVTRLIGSLSSGEAAVEGLELAPELSLELAQWPARVIEVYDEANLYRAPIRYGAERWPSGRVIRLSVRELYANQLADRVLADLDATEALDLFGLAVEPRQRLAVLRRLIAKRAVLRRAKIYQALYEQGRAPRSAEQQRLIRDFPLLTDAVAQEIISAANADERVQLQAIDGRVPMRLAEEARIYQRQIALSRALQGVQHPSLANLDSDRLTLGLLAELAGWSDTVRIELRETSASGRLLASIGQPEGELKVIVRQRGEYLAYDAAGLQLSRDKQLLASLLKALPDRERQALNLDIQATQSLHAVLCSLAVQDRAMAARLLGQQPIKPWFRSPLRLADGRVGYPLGGIIGGDRAINAQLNDLFPQVSPAELEAIKRRLLEENQTLGDAVFKLQSERDRLQQTLDQWVEEARPDVFMHAARRTVRLQLIIAWRRIPVRRRSATELVLSAPDVGSLPVLSARFEHIQSLAIDRMNLRQLPDGFLRCFPRLERLTLEGNPLGVIPPEVSTLTELRHLDVRETRLTDSDTMFDALTPLVRLRSLELQSNRMRSIPDTAVETLARLPALTRLNLRYSRGLSSNGLALLARLPLQDLDLSNTGQVLDHAGAQTFSRFVHLQRLEMSGNPLGQVPELGNLVQLQHLDLEACHLTAWPDGLTTLMNLEPNQLRRVILSRNQITQLPDLASTRFGAALRAQTDATLRLNVHYNPLEADSIARLDEVGSTFVSETTRPPQPGSTWLQGAGQAQRELWSTMFESRQNAALLEMLDRLTLSREFQRDAPALRPRVWTMLELASQHTPLREELLAIAEAFPVTCGDAGADAFSDLEIAVLVFQRSAQATASDRGAELLALYKQLFRRHEVQRLADTLALARIVRRRALLDSVELPPLDPLDDIDDALLRREKVDDIEIRLALRQALAGVLDYPEPSNGMLYRNMANLTPKTIKRVKNAVMAADTVANRHAWMVGENSWRRYLKQRYAPQFDAAVQHWAEGLEYLDYCNGADEVPEALNSDVVDVLRTALDQEPIGPDARPRRLEIGSQVYRKAADALGAARESAETQLLVQLTAAQEAAS